MHNSKSRIVGYFQLTDYLKSISYPLLNRASLVECKAIYYVVSLIAEAEIARVFYNA